MFYFPHIVYIYMFPMFCANGIIALETIESYNESCVCDDRHTESMAVAYRDLPDIP